MSDNASNTEKTESDAITPGSAEAVAESGRVAIARVKFSLLRYWRQDVVGTVDQAAVIEKRRAECALSERYLFMTAMSGGIAVLGLLLSSPAVVIGAMLLSPLMDPIMGLGFALAIGDYRWLRQSAISLAWGSLMAIALCSLVVFMSPLQDITPEIAARTRPNLFDLFVALFSALAGAYAMIRGRDGTIVGVAIATALMPPLAVVGFGLATFSWAVFSGALLLFVTNFVTIALTAWVMAKLYGFRTSLSQKQSQFQNLAVVGVFLALTVPLTLSLMQIVWEANAGRQVRAELAETFGSSARLSSPEIEFGRDPLRVSAFVWTTSLVADAEVRAEENLSEALGTPVDVELKQFLVRDERSAEQAQIASAKAQEEAAASDRVDDLAQRLSLAAGVPDTEVIIDSRNRRAFVRAQRLEGASLSTYRALERRIAASEPEWRIELIPPVAPGTVSVSFEEDGPDAASTQALNQLGWGASRLDRNVAISGPEEEVAAAAAIVRQQGAQVQTEIARGTVQARLTQLEQ
ncbi:MAG: TIGR00341 family protein [Erythrobacter sp.]